MKCSVYASNTTDKQLEFIEQDEWDGKWEKDVMYYSVIDKPRTMSQKQVRKALNYAMTTWDLEIPITFKPYWWGAPVDKPDLTIEFKSKKEDHYFVEKPSVLAYAYFPNQGSVSGKVVFNDEYMWTFQGKGITAGEALRRDWITGTTNPENILRTYSVIAVLIHELGHSLGLRHDVTGNYDGVDVMDAYYSGVNRFELSDRDIYRIVDKYGNRIYSNWRKYGALKKAIKRGKLRLNMFK